MGKEGALSTLAPCASLRAMDVLLEISPEIEGALDAGTAVVSPRIEPHFPRHGAPPKRRDRARPGRHRARPGCGAGYHRRRRGPPQGGTGRGRDRGDGHHRCQQGEPAATWAWSSPKGASAAPRWRPPCSPRRRPASASLPPAASAAYTGAPSAPSTFPPTSRNWRRTPVCVVCAGAKNILDLAKTLEYLETRAYR